MRQIYLILFLTSLSLGIKAQLVNIHVDYDNAGNCIFTATNTTPVPVFLRIDFADLVNTTFTEPLPYIKKIDPGFNNLFTLERYPQSGVPQFNYEISVYKSDPASMVDLDFPYLIPFKPGTSVSLVDVPKSYSFWGVNEPGSWIATGFRASSGDEVVAARMGTVVEIIGRDRGGPSERWYNTWNQVVTLLHPDGTLGSYKNVLADTDKLKLNQKVFPGQPIGRIVDGADHLVFVVYQNGMDSKEWRFIMPVFVKSEKDYGEIASSNTFTVIHPDDIVGRELSKKERRKVLGKKK